MPYIECFARRVRCPINENHMVQEFRYPQHLIKCRKNNPHAQFEVCDFNFSHLVRRGEHKMSEHLLTCPDRLRIEKNHFIQTMTLPTKNIDEASFDDDGSDDGYYVDNYPRSWRIQRNLKMVGSRQPADDSEMSLLCQELSSLLEEGSELEPLPLPKTRSKAFKIRPLEKV